MKEIKIYDRMIVIQCDSFRDRHIVRVIKKRKFFGGKELQRYTLWAGREDYNREAANFIKEKCLEFNTDPRRVVIVNHNKFYNKLNRK